MKKRQGKDSFIGDDRRAIRGFGRRRRPYAVYVHNVIYFRLLRRGLHEDSADGRRFSDRQS